MDSQRASSSGNAVWLILAAFVAIGCAVLLVQCDVIVQQLSALQSDDGTNSAARTPSTPSASLAAATPSQLPQSPTVEALNAHQAAIYSVPGGSPEADLQIANVARYGDYPAIDFELFNSLLAQGDYAQLEALYREREALLPQQPLSELSYSGFLFDLGADASVSLSQLTRWVEETHSEFAYVSRASYYTSAAWDARGYAFAAKTDDDQWEAFHRIAKLAAQDALKAIEINGRSYGGYMTLFRLIGSKAEPMERQALADTATTLFPWSYRMRRSYIDKLRPRWHGSYEKMDAYAASLLKYVPLNPQLWMFQGASHADRANVAHTNGDYQLCLDESNIALGYGVHSSWLTTRADCLEHLQEYSLALRDIAQALAINASPSALRVQNKIYENRPK